MFTDLCLLFRVREKGLELQLGESIELSSKLMQQRRQDHVCDLYPLYGLKKGNYCPRYSSLLV